ADRRPRALKLLSAATLFVAGAIFAVVLLRGSGSEKADSSAHGSSTHAQRAPVDVHNASELNAAIRTASDGTLIVLHAGTYPQTTISRRWTQPVVLQGAAGEKVVVGGFYISNASGVTIQNLQTNGESDVVTGSRNVVFDGVRCALRVG